MNNPHPKRKTSCSMPHLEACSDLKGPDYDNMPNSTQDARAIAILEQRLVPGRPLQIEKDSIGRYTVTLGARSCRGVSIIDALAQLTQALSAPVILPPALVPPTLRSRQAAQR